MPRRFGVEIECVMENAAWRVLGEKLPGWTISTDGSVFCGGEEGETCGANDHECNCEHCDYDPYYYDDECNVHIGAEIKTPILEGVTGYRELKKGFRVLKNEGATVNRTCGMHTHHESTDLTVPEIIRLLKTWDANRETIESFVDESRIGNEYSYELDTFYLNQVEGMADDENALQHLCSWFAHGCEVNVGALQRHGTIELRLHHGTMDYDEAEAWVRFGQGLINDVAGRKRVEGELPAGELLKYTCSTKKSQEILNAKLERRKEAMAARTVRIARPAAPVRW